MRRFKSRSHEPELMDNPAVPLKLLHRNLRELDLLNRYFGGHSLSLAGVKKLLRPENTIYHIVDIGCGSGDFLKYIASWARKNRYKLNLTGIDNNVNAIKFLKQHCAGFPEISGVAIDYNHFLQSGNEADIFVCSLFCHHLDDKLLVDLFIDLKRRSRLGFVINDLHRHPLAYYSVWAFTRLAGGTKLSQNDGPLSVSKAFTRRELELLMQKAGIKNYTIRWRWNFRYCIVVKNS